VSTLASIYAPIVVFQNVPFVRNDVGQQLCIGHNSTVDLSLLIVRTLSHVHTVALQKIGHAIGQPPRTGQRRRAVGVKGVQRLHLELITELDDQA
jgi:hypothetical protein